MVETSANAKAERLSRKRARMLPLLVVIYIAQQASFVATATALEAQSVVLVKIWAWLVLSTVLLAGIATKGFWFQPREVRNLIDDENTRANRVDAMRFGFICAMLVAMSVYVATLYESVSGREAVHVILSVGIGGALVRMALLERRAHRDA